MKRIRIGRRRTRRSARKLAGSLLRELPNLFKLLFRLVRDPAVPGLDKVLLGAVTVYMLTPVDLIPDFLGAIGWVDDLYLLALALGRIITSAGPDRLLRNWDGDPAALGYLVEGVDELGGGLPASMRRALRALVRKPQRLGRKGRRPRRIRIDEDARLHIEE